MSGLTAVGRTPQERYDQMRFACRCCARLGRGPRALIKMAPDSIYALSDPERARRVRLSPDLAVLDDARFFIRGVLRIPVRQAEPAFEFGLWAEVSRTDFRQYLAEYENKRPAFGPFACALDSDLQPYDSRGLPAFLAMRPDKQRPILGFNDGEAGPSHRLAQDMSGGITLSTLTGIYRAWGHTVKM